MPDAEARTTQMLFTTFNYACDVTKQLNNLSVILKGKQKLCVKNSRGTDTPHRWTKGFLVPGLHPYHGDCNKRTTPITRLSRCGAGYDWSNWPVQTTPQISKTHDAQCCLNKRRVQTSVAQPRFSEKSCNKHVTIFRYGKHFQISSKISRDVLSGN